MLAKDDVIVDSAPVSASGEMDSAGGGTVTATAALSGTCTCKPEGTAGAIPDIVGFPDIIDCIPDGTMKEDITTGGAVTGFI